MAELRKIENSIFKNYYEGINGKRRVICILDSNCVRYMVFENGKKKSRKEYSNGSEKLCFNNALKALNK